EAAVRAVVHAVRMSGERELPSRRIGEFVMDELRKLDHVAYVRFASVYRSFQDVADFREEIEKLERGLPSSEQLPLLEAAAVLAAGQARNGERTKKRGPGRAHRLALRLAAACRFAGRGPCAGLWRVAAGLDRG